MKVAQRPKEGVEKEDTLADGSEETHGAGSRHAPAASAFATAPASTGPSHNTGSDDEEEEEEEEGSGTDLRKQMVKRHQKVWHPNASDLQKLRLPS